MAHRPVASRNTLDGLNAGALGLMAYATIRLGGDALVDPLTLLLAAGAMVAITRFRAPSVAIVLAGAIAGVAASLTGLADLTLP